MTDNGGRLDNRRIALGITGSIAAYKAIELLRILQTEGADVRVLMTPSAVEFIGTLTVETLSRHPVDSDVLSLQSDGQIGHIAAAHDVEAIVVAPATAHWLGAMANGLAADTITAACLATSVPVVVAPAMDGGMYSHPATQANVARLREFGYRIVEPESGVLASGMTGQGRLAALPGIVDAVVEALSGTSVTVAVTVGDAPNGGIAPAQAAQAPAPTPDTTPADAAAAARNTTPSRSDLAGRHVVVTAGGTAEPIDPVRFVGNRSTGKMGIAIAEEALDRGAAVTLLLGHHSVEPPHGAHLVHVETVAEMQAALRAFTPPEGALFNILIMAAAVSDFRPRHIQEKKLGRGHGLKLELEATPDLLAETAERVKVAAGASGRRPVLVGFAAEVGALDRAPEKMRSKGVDMIVANDVTEEGSGFGTDTNKVTIYATDAQPEQLPMLSKREVAELLLDRVVVRLGGTVRPENARAADMAPKPEAPVPVEAGR